MTIYGSGQLEGGEIEIDASLSSQFVSSLLLAAPAMKNGLLIKDIGANLPSMPHIEMTISMIQEQGVTVTSGVTDGSSRRWWKVSPRTSSGVEARIEIEPDLSNAAPFLAAALLVGGKVAIKNWPRATTQPGDSLRRIFTNMGGSFTRNGDDLVIEASGDRSDIKGVDIDLSGEGELTPTIATVAAFASTPSHLRGIGHLRIHETDLATELRKVGATVVEGADDLTITPATTLPSGPITISTYDDHRIATLGALVGLMIPGTKVENIATTRKTITDFPKLWSELLSLEL
jgi:3-phosphoshikimate 1-carboxyvinyltransferase